MKYSFQGQSQTLVSRQTLVQYTVCRNQIGTYSSGSILVSYIKIKPSQLLLSAVLLFGVETEKMLDYHK